MRSIRHEIEKSQGAILETLAVCEDRIGATYEAFAGIFPQFAEFWSKLANEERRHAQMLKNLRIFLAHGHLFRNIGRFSPERIQALQMLLDEIHQTLATGKMTASEAFAAAMKLECSLVDGRFYNEVSSDAPEYATVAKAMLNETNEHIARIHQRSRDDIKAHPENPFTKMSEEAAALELGH